MWEADTLEERSSSPCPGRERDEPHATVPIERRFGDVQRTGRGVPAAGRKWLIGWSVTLHERERSHHHIGW